MTQTYALPFSKEFDPNLLERLLLLSEEIQVEKGEVLTKQYVSCNHFYFLLEGSVEFQIQLADTEEDFNVGKSDKQWTPVGWSGFRSPNRYATTVKTTTKSVLLKWKHQDLSEFFEKFPELGIAFLEFVAQQSYQLLDQVRKGIAQNLKSNWSSLGDYKIERSNFLAQAPELLNVLRKSPYFESFNAENLYHFSHLAKQNYYSRGEEIFKSGDSSEKFEILATGSVLLEYEDENGDVVPLKEIDRVGLVINWTGALDNMPNDVKAVATQEVITYSFTTQALKEYFKENPKIALSFYRRLLWLIGNHLRSARARFISLRFEQEILAVKNLFEQNATTLSVRSPLHKVPHLLSNTYTLDDAFTCLLSMLVEGSDLEKSLSQSALDVLGDVYKEFKFFDGLTDVYESVARAPEALEPSEVREICAKKFVNIFGKIPHIIKGEENLPASPNQIFILNHLKNHPFNTLANNFQLTLDSHFVSSMILYRNYGDPGVRVVRMSRGHEYGHQDYYNRLGHIYVYTKDSDDIEESAEEKKARRDQFYAEAKAHLENGRGLILSPEGTSFETEESPGPFKAGAFNLALSLEEEPYIVPIVVANFDKRINHNSLGVVIKEPFKLSEKLQNPNDKNELYAWLESYQQEYKEYVKEAAQIASEYWDKKR